MIVYLLLAWRGPRFRYHWRTMAIRVTFGITFFLLLLNAVSEYVFWMEFSSRYNFIAVDYLVYTNEVVGNIRESYPLATILLAIALFTVSTVFLFRKALRPCMQDRPSFPRRFAMAAGSIIAATILLALYIPPGWQYFSNNNFINELAGNGPYDFVQAFKKNELDYYTYYKTIPDDEAFNLVKNQLLDSFSRYTSNEPLDIERVVRHSGNENNMNVVLISVESFSASFMKAFGNTQNLTPYLDSIAGEGLLFTSLYAAGTRTVRGLEALSLSIPPLPGQSLVKRPDNGDLFSLGSVLKKKGYITQYLYGGYSYFDNMHEFFSHNGYSVIDRSALRKDEIHYANIWGVADEDLFGLAIRQMDSNSRAGRPFFSHIMTVSNHRPFTYPENRIDIAPSTQSREGAVKYTDYCIGRFLQEAAKKTWFKKTIFIIVADHCASSAGKTALPVTGYHIPMIIYSPGNIPPGVYSGLTSQLDIAPTILGMLQMTYTSRFFGRDLFHSNSTARSFISTYQGLGYLVGDTLLVQTPVKKIAAYQVDFTTGAARPLLSPPLLEREAIAFYQVAAWMIRHKKFSASD
ncbi:MAG: LTA synthase family protein [Luteolibacter sp.]